MKVKQLKIQLESLGIPNNIYNLESNVSNSGTVLYQNYDKWEIIHIGDKGEQKIIKVFNNEEDACQFILSEFIKYKNIFSDNYKPENPKLIKNSNIPPNIINL